MKSKQYPPLFLIILSIFSFLTILPAVAQNEYFFPGDSNFDDRIPSPEQFLGYPVGSQHTMHAHVVSYFKALAELSGRVTYQEIGKTYENRPLVILTVTSPENHGRLQSIRENHLKRCDPGQTGLSVDGQPIILHLGYNVHGNEPSGTEAAMLMAYYLTAGQSEEVRRYLDESVIFIDPVLNPDGRDRHSLWVNMHKGSPLVADPLDREHNEAWPGGRTNHYWFDLNRDWLPLVHWESQARMRFYHEWLPNIVTDFHEMGTNTTYFFEPTKPFGSENPVVPRENYDRLNNLLAGYFADALDKLGSLYFTKEVFDNSYPGYGSTYPDLHGGVGLVFEQASSRGHLQQSSTGDLSFAFTIRNHLATSLATVKAGVEHKTDFLDFQQKFFRSAMVEARQDPVKAYIFGDKNDRSKTKAFLNLLLQHQIKCYEAKSDRKIGEDNFVRGHAFIVPTEQPQYRLIRSMFEKVTDFHDSVFYDASAWALVFAYGMPHRPLRTKNFNPGPEVTSQNLPNPQNTVQSSDYAYLIDWQDYYAPKILSGLLGNGIIVKSAFKPFTAKLADGIANQFGYGALMIPVSLQKSSPQDLHQLLVRLSEETGVDVSAVPSGFSVQGVDLGSNSFQPLKQPKVLMVVGKGVSSYEAGEVWHLMDRKVNMAVTKIDITDFARARLNDYNRLVLVSGNYALFGDDDIERIKGWLEAGGTLITIRDATSWVINNKIVEEKLKKVDKEANNNRSFNEPERSDYVTAGLYYGSQAIGGSIYQADLDTTHPLGFGYSRRRLWVYRNSKVVLEPSKNRFSTVIRYHSNPLISGYVSAANLALLSNSASLVVSKVGSGRAILFADNPNFRGTWLGTNKLFLNAVFLGDHMTVP